MLLEQIQTERMTQNQHSSNMEYKNMNYKLQLQLLLTCFSNFSYYYFNENQKAFTLTKFILTICLTIPTMVFAQSLKPQLAKIIKFSSELLSLSQLILSDQFNSLAVILIVVPDNQRIIKKNQKILTYFDGFLIKILLLIYISLFWQNIVIIILSINSFIFESYNLYCVIKSFPYQNIQKTQNIERLFTQSLIVKENLWKRRLQTIPLSILILNKKSFHIEYKNETACQFFNTLCYDENQLNELIMEKLEFTLMQDNLERLRNSSSYIIRKNFSVKPTNSQSCQVDTECFKKTNLYNITDNFINGKYKNLINSKFNTLELYCHQILDQQLFQLTGTIFSSDDDEDLTIVLSDISKQVQLQSFIQKDEFQQKIIESFSHELKTPLNSAINYLKSALSHNQLDQSIKQSCIEPAIIALQLQSYVINDVIDFTQFYANSLELQVKQFEIGDLVSEITNIFSFQFMQKGLEFFVDLSENTKEIIFNDYNRLMQILVNLIQNSLKFTFNGFTILKIKTLSENELQFSITDSGIGIDLELIRQQKQYLSSVESLRHFSHLKSWNGFGLIISSIILNSLNPGLQESFRIKSEQRNGTKVKFRITNIIDDEKYQPSQIQIRRRSTQHTKVIKYQYSNHVIGSVQIGNQISNQNLEPSNKYISSFVISSQNNELDLGSNGTSYQKLNVYEKMKCLLEQPHNFILDIKKKSNSSLEQHSMKSSKNRSKIYSFDQVKSFEIQTNEANLLNFVKKIQCGCRKIMSIDDEIFNQNSIKMLISRYGFEVITAYNGQEAIQKIQQLKKCSNNCVLLNLIIMDYSIANNGWNRLYCLTQKNDVIIINTKHTNYWTYSIYKQR